MNAEKPLYVLIVIFTFFLFSIGVCILIGTIMLFSTIQYTMNSIITILFIIFAVITGFCIFGVFCIRYKPLACLLYMIALGITSTAFITLGAVMLLGQDMFVNALIESLKDSEAIINKIVVELNKNIDKSKIVLLSVPVVPLLLLCFTYCYRNVCKRDLEDQKKKLDE